ncbi:MAG: helical backbone metal receptor [bacterium]
MKKLLTLLFAMLITGNLQAVIITDDVGRKVEVNIPVESIVCLSPAHTEMIFWLGKQDLLAAVSTNCDWPAGALKKEKAGSFMTPDVEKIVKLKPSVVISGGGIQKKAISRLEKLGIPVLVLYPMNLSKGIWNDITILGNLTGDTVVARDKIVEFEMAMNRVSAPSAEPLKVYMELWNQPVMAIGKTSFINEAIRLAGGKNILSDARTEYPKVSPEEIIKRNPDVIILLYKPEADYLKREYFLQTIAGKKGNIFVLDTFDMLLRPGPRIPQAIRILKQIFHKAAAK